MRKPEWINTHPARAIKIYFKGSRSEAVKQNCIDCVGTSQEATKCPCMDCPLWPFRPGATKGELPPFVPSEEELRRQADEKVPDAVREHARKMGEARRES
jgi:hypothetical protein